MDSERKYTTDELFGLSYRFLQQMAKSMGLPSNVKKVYLIQLIYAKTNKTAAEVESIVQSVKLERQRITMTRNRQKGRRRNYIQTMEVSSTNTCLSPPIDLTPKRSKTPESPSYAPKTIICYPSRNINPSPKNGSDRVLRSYNRSYKKPNYCLLNNSILGVIKASEPELKHKETQVSIVGREGKCQQLKLTTQCLMKNIRPSVLNAITCIKKKQINPTSIMANNAPAIVPAKRVRFPNVNTIEKPIRINYLQSIGYRHNDGRVSKINAVIQKTAPKPYSRQEISHTNTMGRSIEVTVQDIINRNIEAQAYPNPNLEYTLSEANLNYPNMCAITDVINQRPNETVEDMGTFSMYYHKKIRSEQVRNKRYPPAYVPRNTPNEQTLPKINDVFSRFSNTRDYTQPLYIHINDDNDAIGRNNNWMLESLYTLKKGAIPHTPLLQVTTTSNTTCVYSTPVISTSMQQASTLSTDESIPMSSFESCYPNYGCSSVVRSTSEEVSRVCDLAGAEQDMTLRRYQEAANASGSSLDTTIGTTATIPEMVEDAMELISQDGDYMERINMDERMQCILCSWAGPKFVLEYHIKEEHASQIMSEDKDEFIITFKLGSLVNQDMWISQVCDRHSELYILSVKYEDPNCFMASLSTLSTELETKTGTITLYHKVTGEPFVWHGEVEELHTNMPYKNTQNCFKVDLSKLELLPNSANLKLHNGSLVLNSPSKVVVGQPELNDIHINIFVTIQDF